MATAPYISLNQGQVQKQVGVGVVGSGGEFGDQLFSELQPRLYEQTYRGNSFSVTYAAGAAAAASATAAGAFSFYNPAGSGKNVVILDITSVLVSFTAATTPLQLALQPFTQTMTSVTGGNAAVNSFIGGPTNAAAVAKTATAGTMVGASTTAFAYIGAFYVDLAAGDTPASIVYNADGRIILAPGSGFNVVAIATVPTNTIALGITWMEVVI